MRSSDATRYRVALDARDTRQLSVGMRRYTQELSALLPGLAPDLEFLALKDGENFSIAEQIGLPLQLKRSGARLVHHMSLYAPVLPTVPTVVTLHDLIHLRYPEQFKAHVQPYYRIVVRNLCRRAKRVITDDEKTVDDLQRYLGVAERKIRIIPLGVGEVFLRDRFAADPKRARRPYLFYAGNHRAHKDLATAFRAWAALPDDIADDLCLTGVDDVDAVWPRSRPGGAQVRFMGELSDTELAETMYGARALVYPSLYEGFGLPMLEALAVGTPVIASRDALPGVLSGHAHVFTSGDDKALLQAILALDTPSSKDRQTRRAYSATFTWERCALATAQVYREVLEETCVSP